MYNTNALKCITLIPQMYNSNVLICITLITSYV